MVSRNSILSLCSKGTKFGEEVQKWASPQYSETIFIDPSRGSPSGEGHDWANAVDDFNAACDAIDSINANDSYLFVVRGRVTSGNAMDADQEIDVRNVTVVGNGIAWGGGTQGSTITLSHTPTQASTNNGVVGLLADERNINLHGVHFYNPDCTVNQWEFAWGDSDGQNAAVTDCWFEGQNDGDTSAATWGLYAEGTIHNVIARNQFSYCEIGLAGRGGSSRYFHNATIDNNTFSSCATSINLMTTSDMNLVTNNIIRQKGYLGYTLVAGIDCDASANYNQFLNNVCFDGTEATAYLDGGTGNLWIGNKYGEGTAGEGSFYDDT